MPVCLATSQEVHGSNYDSDMDVSISVYLTLNRSPLNLPEKKLSKSFKYLPGNSIRIPATLYKKKQMTKIIIFVLSSSITS